MKMGIGLAMATLGAILRYAIDSSWDAVDLKIVGLILMIVGAIAFGTSAALEFTKNAAAKQKPPAPVAVPPTAPPAAGPSDPTPKQTP